MHALLSKAIAFLVAKVTSSPKQENLGLAALITVATFFATDASWAQAITVLSADRLVEARGMSFCPGCGPNGEDEEFYDSVSIPSSLAGVFDEEAISIGSSAGQESNISSEGIEGNGFVSTGFSFVSEARSTLTVSFTVPATSGYRLSGGFEEIVDLFGGFAEAYVTLSGSSGVLFRADNLNGASSFEEDLLLQSGMTYQLNASVESLGDLVDSGWSVSFSAIPEPGSLILLGIGSSTLLAWRRGKR